MIIIIIIYTIFPIIIITLYFHYFPYTLLQGILPNELKHSMKNTQDSRSGSPSFKAKWPASTEDGSLYM